MFLDEVLSFDREFRVLYGVVEAWYRVVAAFYAMVPEFYGVVLRVCGVVQRFYQRRSRGCPPFPAALSPKRGGTDVWTRRGRR